MKNITLGLVVGMSMVWAVIYFSRDLRDFLRPLLGGEGISLLVEISLLFVIFLPIFIVIVFLPSYYFRYWFRFALIGLPLTLGAIIYLNIIHTPGLFGWNSIFYPLFYLIFVSFFILGSLSALGWAWWRGR